MKVAVICDGDGHFHVAPINDRKKVVDLIKKIADGDHFANSEGEYQDILNDDRVYKSLYESSWLNTIQQYVQRGMFEIIEL